MQSNNHIITGVFWTVQLYNSKNCIVCPSVRLYWQFIMVLIFDGNSEIGTYVLSDFGYLFCLRHLIRSRVVTNLIFSSSEITSFFARAQHILRRSYISTMNQPKHVWFGSGFPYSGSLNVDPWVQSSVPSTEWSVSVLKNVSLFKEAAKKFFF